VKARFVFAGAALAVVAASIACGSTKNKGSLVLALETDVAVPANVNGIGISIAIDGHVQYSKLFALDQQVLNDKKQRVVKLPATIALVEPADSSAPQVAIRAVAFHDGEARIVRDVITTVPHARTALLRLPMQYLGYKDGVSGGVPANLFAGVGTLQAQDMIEIHLDDVADGGGLAADINQVVVASKCSPLKKETNVDGVCVSYVVDSSTLPDYVKSDVFEGDVDSDGLSLPEKCFEVEECFADGGTSVALDKSGTQCSFKLPSGFSDSSTLNVAMQVQHPVGPVGFCVGGSCLVPINRDDAHGFQVEGNVVRLPRGVCEHTTVTGVVVSKGCPAKLPVMPIDGAGANCLDNNADGGPTTDAAASGDAEGGSSQGDSGTAAIWYAMPGATGVATNQGIVFAIAKDKAIASISAKSGMGLDQIPSATADVNAPTAAFIAADATNIYASFNQTVVVYTTYSTVGVFGQKVALSAFDGAIGASTDNVTLPVIDATYIYLPSPNHLDGNVPYVPLGQTSAAYQSVPNAFAAYAFSIPNGGNTLYAAYKIPSGAVAGGFGTRIASGFAAPTTIFDLDPGITYGFAAAQLPSNKNERVVLTTPSHVNAADQRVYLGIVTVANNTYKEIAPIGSSTDPGFLMRNLASDANGIVYFTDDAGNLSWIDPFATTPVITKMSSCAGSLGVAVDAAYVYRACAAGITRDKIAPPRN
jgi:hypothetical protein